MRISQIRSSHKFEHIYSEIEPVKNRRESKVIECKELEGWSNFFVLKVFLDIMFYLNYIEFMKNLIIIKGLERGLNGE